MAQSLNIPEHLKRYIVDQDYSRYSAIDQSTWRYILRQLRNFLSANAHECYLEGLEKTGITIDEIPRIENISRAIEKFGWKAVPVSGFIPPAAFMELQSLSILPIAGDMRAIEHLMYTPAPDIVHEAAGHAPILVNPQFASYLKRYAQVARKAIISHEDLALYEAIRHLSDIKEDMTSTPEEIEAADRNLIKVQSAMTHASEAALLARMNWWTAEYGLIGPIENPKIFGAGLLSSVGESRECLSSKVKKIPLTLKCIDQGYDITEPQPQLFVAPDFETLSNVLEEMSETMAFKRGERFGLDKILDAKTVNTIELNSGLQISGVLEKYLSNGDKPFFIKFSGPCQLALKDEELPGQGKAQHAQGYSTPLGFLISASKCLSQLNDAELAKIGLVIGESTTLSYETGNAPLTVQGHVKNIVKANNQIILVTFDKCTVKYGDQILFEPGWGDFDMGVGSHIPSVFGGPADREAFGPLDDFIAKRVPSRPLTLEKKLLNKLYLQVRGIRKSIEGNNYRDTIELNELFESVTKGHPNDWLLKIEILECAYALDRQGLKEASGFAAKIADSLKSQIVAQPEFKAPIEDGLRIAAI